MRVVHTDPPCKACEDIRNNPEPTPVRITDSGCVGGLLFGILVVLLFILARL